MPDPTDPTDPLPESRRREVFAALVKAQDRGMSVEWSRHTVAANFHITAARVAEIEREGLDNEWPPL
jgi:hypothetical protein